MQIYHYANVQSANEGLLIFGNRVKSVQPILVPNTGLIKGSRIEYIVLVDEHKQDTFNKDGSETVSPS